MLRKSNHQQNSFSKSHKNGYHLTDSPEVKSCGKMKRNQFSDNDSQPGVSSSACVDDMETEAIEGNGGNRAKLIGEVADVFIAEASPPGGNADNVFKKESPLFVGPLKILKT